MNFRHHVGSHQPTPDWDFSLFFDTEPVNPIEHIMLWVDSDPDYGKRIRMTLEVGGRKSTAELRVTDPTLNKDLLDFLIDRLKVELTHAYLHEFIPQHRIRSHVLHTVASSMEDKND